jgi:murein L,D-transpeptidase YcbB/YkuD
MWGVRLDRFLTGTAAALVLAVAPTLTASAQDAGTSSPAAEVSVPMPAATPPGATEPEAPAAERAGPASAPASTPVADALRGLSAGKFDRLIGSRKDREAIDSFYQARDYAPIWIENQAVSPRGEAAIKYLADVASHGLEPSDYPVPALKAEADTDALAEAEIRLTDSVLDFARHAQVGRVHFSRVSADIDFVLQRPEPTNVLVSLADAKDVAAALEGFTPQHPGYKALKTALAEARKTPEAKSDQVIIGRGPTLKPGMSDPRVVELRKRLGIAGDPASEVYDNAVSAAVKNFQRAKGIGADGVLGPGTLRALNGTHHPTADPVSTIIANMERWRWLPRDLGRTYVMVNVPDFTLRVVRDHRLVWSTKIVVGKPNLKTPLTTAAMKYITVNPTWNVPPSIIRNEYLPVIQQDPKALERTGLKMEQNPDGTIRIFQPPGDRNALGRIRFNFPNKFLVYQHDTPDKKLFARDVRAYSHGCMRVQDPLKYGEVLLSLVLPNEDYTQARLRSMFGGSERDIHFPRPIPVHLTYQSAFVDEDGKLQIRGDIYGWDAALLAWFRPDQRKIADTAIDRPKVNFAAPVMMPPGLVPGSRQSEPSFFERLFGLSAEPEPPPPPRRGQRRRSVSGGGRGV